MADYNSCTCPRAARDCNSGSSVRHQGCKLASYQGEVITKVLGMYKVPICTTYGCIGNFPSCRQ